MVEAKRRSLEVKQGRIPKKYQNLISNEQWHSWSIPPKDLAIREDNARMDSIIQQHQQNVEIVLRLAGLVLGEQEMSLDDQHPYPLLTKIVTELAEMILADSEHSLSEKRSPFTANQETIDKTKTIGTRLNAIGGWELMGAILNDCVPHCDQLRWLAERDRHELDWLWHGIGYWKAKIGF